MLFYIVLSVISQSQLILKKSKPPFPCHLLPVTMLHSLESRFLVDVVASGRVMLIAAKYADMIFRSSLFVQRISCYQQHYLQ
jgi:hypothetical protein